MMHFPILTSLIALPVVGAILLLFVRGDEEQSAPFVRQIALMGGDVSDFVSAGVVRRLKAKAAKSKQ